MDLNLLALFVGCFIGWILIIFVFPSFFTRLAEYFYTSGQKSFFKTISAYRAFRATISYYFGKYGRFYLFLSSFPAKFLKISCKKTACNKHQTGYENTDKKFKSHKNTISKNKKDVKE